MPVSLALVLHAHQPVDNFDHVIAQAFETAYLPFLDALERRPWLRASLHYSGFLLDWIAARHPEYIARLRRLREAGQIELLGGGYYEPILSCLREPDRQAQLQRLSLRLEQLSGIRPSGAWLAERVWQSDIAASLARAGLLYTVVDDTHFLLTGLAQAATWRPYWTEFQGERLQLVASDHFLRRAIPFLPERQAIDYLLAAPLNSNSSPEAPPPLLVMGDDLEKFGSWPQTYEHVYRQGWLDRFFNLLETEQPRIVTVRLEDYLRRFPARSRIHPPNASYEEMMLWALPPEPALRLQRLRQVAEDSPASACRPFLTGAAWGNFLVRYPEANHLHKRMLDVSHRLEAMTQALGGGADPAAASASPSSAVAGDPAAAEDPAHELAAAREHLLAAQANDVYWHGLFGGIYAPHLRNTAYRHLLAADRRLAQFEGCPPWRRQDFELTGAEQIELRTPQLRLQFDPAAGGTLTEIEFLPAEANLTHAIARRPERYHEQILQHRAGHGIAPLAGYDNPSALASTDLAAALLYDRYERVALRLWLFPDSADFNQYRQLQLHEAADWAAGEYVASAPQVNAHAISLSLRREASLAGKPLAVVKRVTLARMRPELEIELRLAPADCLAGWRFGLEWIVNLLAPGADDRYLETAAGKLPLDWTGELAGDTLAWYDGWRHCRLRFQAPAACWWLQPIYTVSQSEAGFERIYQGSAALAVWPAGAAHAHLRLAIET